MTTQEIVTCGDQLGSVNEYVSGEGTYTLNNSIYASVVGIKTITPATTQNASKSTIQVLKSTKPTQLPKIGDIVIAQVTKINTRQANVNIFSVDGQVAKEPFPGSIRTRDVRAFDIDLVKMHESFRPNDIVKAQVLSLGDSKSYFLTTAQNDLGVMLAHSATGHVMVPIRYKLLDILY